MKTFKQFIIGCLIAVAVMSMVLVVGMFFGEIILRLGIHMLWIIVLAFGFIFTIIKRNEL